MPWEIRYFETSGGLSPVRDFLRSLPPKHRAKVRHAIGRLELFGPRLGFPDTSHVRRTAFRELRTRFAGAQYRILYVQDADTIVLFVAFRKTGERDLVLAVREAEKHLESYRSERGS